VHTREIPSSVLIVEDDNSIRAVLRATLRSAGYTVFEASDGVQALALAAEHLPDLVLSDVMMPGGNGPEFLAALRADPRTTDLPFVFLTGLDERESVRAGMNLGADDYLTKPFRPTELLSLVQAQLRRSYRRTEVRKKLEAEAQMLRQFDPITGLPNRSHFLGSLLRDADGGLPDVVASVALGQLPLLRQSLGQGPADEIMREGANRLLESARARLGPDCVLGRTGEHRFALALRAQGGEEGIESLLREVLAPLGLPMQIDGRRLFFDPSAGLAVCPRDGDTPDALLNRAETAEPATAPGGTVAFYSAENSAARGRRVRLLQDLRMALERKELSLAFQPQVAMNGEKLVGFEALLRWYHPEFGQVPPVEFIPLAEESGLIIPIGAWVLREGAQQLRSWLDEGLRDIRVAVNLSPRQFEDPALLPSVEAVLAEFSLPPGSLELEITESVALHDPEPAIVLMKALRARGVALALDDFGTGFSNLSQLKRLPIDVLKIDQIFVRHIVTDTGDAAIVSAVSALAHGFGMKVLAEGVESPAQVIKLAQLGCDICQGYHYGAPMLAEGVPGWLSARGITPGE
jgi:EAL domain-containing protein (putative c-di-GMP-specific phosphodiesterase class I)/CheY-like chemotaxis protein